MARLVALLVTTLTAVRCGTDSPTEPGPGKLAFTIEPGTVVAGAVITPAVRAVVQDGRGNTVTASTDSLTISITSGTGSPGATLGGTLKRVAVNGIATFDDLIIEKAAAGYTLTVRAGNLQSATSTPFTVEPGAATSLLLAHPTTVIAGSPLILEVTLRDSFGNVATGTTADISVAILAGGTGAVLDGTLTRTTVNGIATFDDLTIRKAGGYRLSVTATDIGSVVSGFVTVDPGVVSQISLTDAPDVATVGHRIAPVRVVALDDYGNIVRGSTAEISIAITAGTGAAGAALSGTLTRAVDLGVATFDDISIDKAGTGYTLTVEAAGVVPAATGPFDVTTWSFSPTLIGLESDAGDYIGQGQTYQYTLADAQVSATATYGRFSLNIRGDEWWTGQFQVPDSLVQLVPGMYAGLTRYPFADPATGGLSWSGEGRGCNTLTGWLAVDSVAYDGAALVGIHLRFEQHCEGGGPALRGMIHWDADDPTTPPGPVYPIPTGLWAPATGSTPVTGSYVYLESDAGDYIGQGQTYEYTSPTSTIVVSSQAGLLSVAVAGWFSRFQTMNTLASLKPGYYADLQRYPFHNPTKGGLDWSGQGRGCNRLNGWFAIDSATYENGELTTIALRFEQHCEGNVPSLRGAIRWTR